MHTNFGISPELWEEGKRSYLDSWPLYRDPTSIALIIVAYIGFVLYLGPKFMEMREPYNLKTVLILYNAMQVLFNFSIFVCLALQARMREHFFNFGCVETAPQEEHEHFQMMVCLTFWLMTVNKIMDLFDTVFFVLCKKQSHVSFLHVQHHVLTMTILWIIGKYFIGLELAATFCANTIVHTIMYSYYFVAALGPAYKKYLWWKKYLTLLQIGQFLFIIAYMVASFWLSCGFNHVIVWLIIVDASLNSVLFFKFYYDAYNSKKLMITDKTATGTSLPSSSNYTENQNVENVEIGTERL